MAALPHSSKRRSTARKRLSALRLSTDTTSPLPAYSAPPRHNQASNWPTDTTPPLDRPPDYPQSAEDADREEDDFVPHRLPRNPVHRRLRHRRTSSTSSSASSAILIPPSPSVDDLLERSVVALELSTNALLQSMNTQSSLSAIANDQILERSLDRQRRMLDLRLRGNAAAHNGWMENLDDVMKRVDGLFLDPSDDPISRSLPDRTSHMHSSCRPEPPKSASDSPYFHLTTSSEVDLRDTIRPPRALTQYVSIESNFGDASETSANPESICLPSTLGLRSAAQMQTFTTGSSPQRRIRKSPSSLGPDFSHTSTSAYNILSNLASGQTSRSPTGTGTPSTSDSRSRRTARRYSAGSADSNFAKRPRSQSRGGSSTSTDTPPPPVRAMTPPMEESTPSSSDSSSENNKIKAFRAMQSLRKILDDTPPPPDPKGKRRALPPRCGFQPRTPPVAPSAGESTATASVYRLYTRSSHRHASSSHPKQSSLKKSPRLFTPVLPDTPSASSGHSTPRQVSFAELPVDHPGRPRNKNKGRRKAGKEKEKEDKGWMSWFTSPGTPMWSAAGVYEERMEDKMMRGLGRPAMGGGTTEDWML